MSSGKFFNYFAIRTEDTFIDRLRPFLFTGVLDRTNIITLMKL